MIKPGRDYRIKILYSLKRFLYLNITVETLPLLPRILINIRCIGDILRKMIRRALIYLLPGTYYILPCFVAIFH